jgi:opine dehydrogenase
MVLLSTLGDLLKIPTPTHDAVIHLTSVINRANYLKTGRGVKQLGISGLNRQGLKKFLLEGKR